MQKVCLIYLQVFLFWPFLGVGEEIETAVAQVLDGDTFTTTRGDTVRLLGINTPEPGLGRRPKEPFGPQASAIAKKMLKDQPVRLVIQKKSRDRYGRLLANAYLPDGTWVNTALLAAGAAHVYTFPDSTYNLPALFAAEAEARAARKGLWGLPRWTVKQAATCCTEDEIGEFQLVEGTVKQVVKVNNRTYLNFGDDWRTDFTAMVEGPAHDLFADLTAYQGQKLRVRGYLRPVNGALVKVTHPAQLESLAPNPAANGR